MSIVVELGGQPTVRGVTVRGVPPSLIPDRRHQRDQAACNGPRATRCLCNRTAGGVARNREARLYALGLKLRVERTPRRRGGGGERGAGLARKARTEEQASYCRLPTCSSQTPSTYVVGGEGRREGGRFRIVFRLVRLLSWGMMITAPLVLVPVPCRVRLRPHMVSCLSTMYVWLATLRTCGARQNSP